MAGSGQEPGEAAERLAAEARASAEALLDWLGPRLEGVRGADGSRTGPSRPTGARTVGRPPQSGGPCAWCPVCALVAALRGEQPELTARLAEQAAGLVVLVRLLIEGHGTHHHAGASDPTGPPDPDGEPDGDDGENVDEHAGDDVDGTTAAHVPPGSSDPARPGERPTGRRSPRPSPRLRAVPRDDEPVTPQVPRRRPAVERIPVRRVPSDPC